MTEETKKIQKMLNKIKENKRKEINNQDQITIINKNQKDIYDDDNWGMEDR